MQKRTKPKVTDWLVGLRLGRLTRSHTHRSRSARIHSILSGVLLGVLSLSLVVVFSYTRGNTNTRVYATTSSNLNFQARLQTNTGGIVPDGTYNVEFKLYNASSSSGSSQGSCTGDAACLWSETYTGASKITVQNGYLSVYLGSINAFPSINWDQNLYLTMNVGGTGAASWDGEMSPRIQLTAVPYAFQAQAAQTLNKTVGSFQGTVDFASLTANRKYLLPDTALATTASPGTICVFNGTNSNCPAATGSAYYIQNSTGSATPQTQANFNIQATDSGVNGTIGGIIRGAAGGQTVDLFQLQNTAGNVLTNFDATGYLHFNRAAASSDNVLTVRVSGDSNDRFTIGADGKLQWGSGSGALDVGLFREQAGVLRTQQELHVGPSGITAQLGVANGSASKVGLIVRAAASQTADIQQVQAGNGEVLSKFDANGQLLSYGTGQQVLSLATPSFTTAATGTAYYYVITATNAAGETVASTALGMANNTSTLNWNQVNGATGYKIYRNTSNSFSSGSLLLATITNGTTVSFTDSGAATTAGLPPATTTGTKLVVQAWGGQSGDLLQLQRGDGTLLARIDNHGSFFHDTTQSGYGGICIQNTASSTCNASLGGVSIYAETINTTSVGQIIRGRNSAATVTNKALTSNVATLTTSAAHGFYVGQSVVVAGVDATFNGTYTITSIPTSTTFTYAKTASDVSSTAASGTATSYAQSADLLQLQDSGGNVLSLINAAGTVKTLNQGVQIARSDQSSVTTATLFTSPYYSSNGSVGFSDTNNALLPLAAPSLRSYAGGSNYRLELGSNYLSAYTAGTQRLYIDSSGNIALGNSATPGAALDVLQGSTAASGVAYGSRFQQTLTAAANNDTLTGLYVNPSYTNGSFTGVTNIAAQINTGAAGATGLVVKGAASQSGDLLQLQNSSGVVAKFNASGGLLFGPSSDPGSTNGFATIGADGSYNLVLRPSSAGSNVQVLGANLQLSPAKSITFFGGSGSIDTYNGGATTLTLTNSSGAGAQFTEVVKAGTSQATDLLQLQDSSGLVNAAFNAAGNQLTLGRIAGTGTVTQGKLIFSDGTTDGFATTLQTATLTTGSRTLTIPDTAGVNDTVCLLTLANCGSTGAFVQGGNTFSGTTAGDLGTNNNGALNIRTNGTTKLTVSTAGDLTFAQGANRTLSVAANSTANGAGYNFTLAAGAADGTAAGNIGGNLVLQGGAAAGSGNNNGGNITVDGGAKTGTGTKGYVVLQGSGGNVGIGISTPNTALQVNGQIRVGGNNVGVDSDSDYYISSGGQLHIRANDGASSNGSFTDLLLEAGSATSAASNIRFLTQNVERLTVTSSGKIGIGTPSPSANLTFDNSVAQGINVLAQGTGNNNAGTTLTVAAGNAGSQTTGNVGGILTLLGGAAAGTGNNNGGNVTIDGGTATGTGTKGNIVLQGAVTVSGSGSVSGVTTLSTSSTITVGTLGTADTSTILCRNSSNQIATCSGNGAGVPFIQGGNSFTGTTDGDLGTNNNGNLNFRTNNATRLTVTTGGDLQFAQGGNRTLNVAANTTANAAGNNLTISAGAANGSTTGNAGGTLVLTGGAAAGTGNNNGGNLTLNGGAATGTGIKGNIVLQTGGGNVGIGTTPGATNILDVAAGYASTVNITSDMTSGARSNALVSISQASAANHSTGVLLDIQNNDSGSTAAVVQIGQQAAGNNLALYGAGSATKLYVYGNQVNSGYGIRISGNDANHNGANAFTGRMIDISPTNTLTSGNITDSGNFLSLNRNNTVNNAGSIYTVSGALADLQSTCTQTAGTCNDSGSILNLTQNYASATGNVLNVTNAGVGDAIVLNGKSTIVSGSGTNLSLTSGTTGSVTVDSSTTGNVNVGTGGSSKAVTIGNTTGTTGVTINTGSNGLTFGTSSALFNQTATLGASTTTTANAAGFNLTIKAGNANGSTTGNTGGVLALQGGAAAGSGNNNGGNLTLNGGTATGTGVIGNVLLQGSGGLVGIGASAGTPDYTLTVQGGGSAAGAHIERLGIGIGSNEIDEIYSATDTGKIYLNYSGYQGGNSYYRDLFVGNGKQSATPVLFVQGSTGRVGIGTSSPTADLQFGGASDRTINTGVNTTNAAGHNLTVAAGAAGSGASAFSGGSLVLQGGAAGGTGNANGGTITLAGGAGIGTGVQGLVYLSPTAYTATGSTQTFGSSGSLSAGLVDTYSTIPVSASATGVTVTVPAPASGNQIVGRLLYVTAVSGSNDFTLSLTGTSISIAMKANSTATLIWNGTGWTAAGASSSTDLQSAYNNTLTSAGGAELVLAAPGGNADGLTVRNNGTTPITGALLEVQTSIGSNLFSVNNNATEYASNGGAETAGGSSSTFPSSTWSASATGGSTATVARETGTGNFATGQASVKVVTTGSTTGGQGAADQITATLTPNLQYYVSFTVKGTTNFSTLDVVYSKDGTNTATTTCATGKTVTQSIWSKVTCSFIAPSSGITSSNAIFIRQSDSNTSATTYYIDNLSINVSASVNHASDGSVDSALGTNWVAFGSGSTVTRITTNVYDTSGSVQVDTTNTANLGVQNNLTISPSTSTQYLVTFYAKLNAGTFTDIRVRYTRDGGTNFVTCTDYNTQILSTSAWTKFTCILNTDSTAASSPAVVIDQPTAPGSTRTFYVDALSVTLNTNTANNVQIGGANKGGPVTLLTLDRASSAPIAANNDAYLGSMYFDTTTGRIQCYETGGWGACGAPPDNIVNLNPEYAGSVLNGTGVGTMTSDFCAQQTSVLNVNTSFCATGEARNFYKWTSPQATQQTYSIYVTYQLPSTFKGFSSDDTVQLTGRVDSTTNAVVTYEMFRSQGGTITACGTETTVTSTANTWQTVGINGNEATGCGFSSSSASAFVIFKINVKAQSNANAYVSTLSFTTTGR